MLTARQSQLREVFARHSGPFAYGTDDCVSLARDAVHALTGRTLDLPTWHDEASAAAVIARYGSLYAAVEHALGAPSSDSPQDGDVVLVRAPNGTELCGVWANGRPVARCTHGVVPLMPRWVVACWRIA